MVRVLFLCLGNICRSPMAEAVFRQMVRERGLHNEIEIDSAGLGDWHVGDKPHRGTREILDRYKIPYDSIYSRQITSKDLADFTYIVAMDEDNIEGLSRLGKTPDARVFRLLDLVDEAQEKNVPDPYFTGNFDEVYRLVRVGCERLLQKIIAHHALSQNSGN